MRGCSGRRGRIAVGGRTLFDPARGLDLPPRERRIGYVPRDLLLFPHLDVRANLLDGSRRTADRAAAFQQCVEILEVGGLLARRVHALSGGERQRVALAAAYRQYRPPVTHCVTSDGMKGDENKSWR